MLTKKKLGERDEVTRPEGEGRSDSTRGRGAKSQFHRKEEEDPLLMEFWPNGSVVKGLFSFEGPERTVVISPKFCLLSVSVYAACSRSLSRQAQYFLSVIESIKNCLLLLQRRRYAYRNP